MRIGILTYHRTHNYGAFLQAVATRELMNMLGCEAFYVDYWPLYHRNKYRLFDMTQIRKAHGLHKLSYLLRMSLYMPFRIKRRNTFESYIDRFILPYCESYGKARYDALLYGSDQIWRKQTIHDGCFNPVYFGENTITTNKTIAWAASMGNMNLTVEDNNFLSTVLKHFDAISVRESSLQTHIKSLGINSYLVCDPTMMLDIEQWNQIFPESMQRIIKEPYALYYPLIDGIDENQMKQYVKQHNLRLITLRGEVNSWPRKDEFVSASPAQMLSLIKHAEVVFTSSFHGMVFGILNRRNIVAGFSNNADRAKSLLTDLGLHSCLMCIGQTYPLNIHTDYEGFDEKLNAMRTNTRTFINTFLK